jgi:DNA/RNA endonuclease YhcR with UshA esterase domain
MATKNDITGDSIQTKGTSKDYRDNYDIIFRKKDEDIPFWEHYCTQEDTLIGVESGSACNWCGLTEDDFIEFELDN